MTQFLSKVLKVCLRHVLMPKGYEPKSAAKEVALKYNMGYEETALAKG